MSIKIAVVLQQGDKTTRKPWRFNPSDISTYRLADVEEDILQLFPDVAKRDCKLTFQYKDSLVGDVELESDRDLQEFFATLAPLKVKSSCDDTLMVESEFCFSELAQQPLAYLILKLNADDSLQSFTEESDVQYKTFIVTEKRKPVNVSTPSAASSDPIVSPKAKRRKLPDQTIPKEKIENTLANAEKEIGLPDKDQPLYIDEEDGLIKCKWCGKNFSGSQQMRCINQHVRKSAAHRQARKKFLSNTNSSMEDQSVSGINDGDQTDHDYIQMYMHPKPSDCNQSATDDNDHLKRSTEESDQDTSDHNKLDYVQDIIEVYLNTEMQDDNSNNSFPVTEVVTSKCYGIYDTKYVELLGTKQRQTTEELWTQGRNSETNANCHATVQCICCNTYDSWKSSHPDEYKLLQECAIKQESFGFFPNERVVVLENGIPVEYTGIVHSTGCAGTATSSGDHPYQCSACHTLLTTMLPQEFNNS